MLPSAESGALLPVQTRMQIHQYRGLFLRPHTVSGHPDLPNFYQQQLPLPRTEASAIALVSAQLCLPVSVYRINHSSMYSYAYMYMQLC